MFKFTKNGDKLLPTMQKRVGREAKTEEGEIKGKRR